MNLIRIGQRPPATYRGMTMKANPELHDEVAGLVRRILPPGAKILDMGCGEGAFSQRLADLGYEVQAVDSDESAFKGEQQIFTRIDLNSPGLVLNFVRENSEKFDLVIGMEVIEHVENPWDFVRTLTQLARPDGHIIITTPNIESWLSKIKFLFEGQHFHFTAKDFETSGHINPVSAWELRTIAQSVGLSVEAMEASCPLPVIWLGRTLRLFLYSLFNLLLGVFLGSRSRGDILVAHLVKQK